MRNIKKTIHLVTTAFAFSLVASSAMAHPGDHDSNLVEVASHMLTSPWHQMIWLVGATFLIGLFLAVARKQKSSD